jgi:large subunit ribosomal protein L35
MPKTKTNSGAAKRFKVTASGKVLRKSAFRRHLLASKNAKRRRGLRGSVVVAEVDTPRVKELLAL